jgi:hypothetical protein
MNTTTDCQLMPNHIADACEALAAVLVGDSAGVETRLVVAEALSVLGDVVPPYPPFAYPTRGTDPQVGLAAALAALDRAAATTRDVGGDARRAGWARAARGRPVGTRMTYETRVAAVSRDLGRLLIADDPVPQADLSTATVAHPAVLGLLTQVHRDLTGIPPRASIMATEAQVESHPVALLGRLLAEHPRVPGPAPTDVLCVAFRHSRRQPLARGRP